MYNCAKKYNKLDMKNTLINFVGSSLVIEFPLYIYFRE